VHTGPHEVTAFLPAAPCIYPIAELPWRCSKEKNLMPMPIATYSFSAKADRKAAHVRGADADAPLTNVTLAERLAR
jgi:hypothetical protein